MLNFDEEKHEYYLDNKRIPSVSEIMKSITVHFYTSEIPENILKLACIRGSEVHKAIYDYELFDEYEIANNHLGYFEQYQEWKNKIQPKILYQEKMLTNGEYAGTIDYICAINGETWLIDFKTSRDLHENLVSVQLQAYKELAEKNGIKIDKLGVLHLEKNKYTFKEINGNKKMWEICKNCYEYIKGFDYEICEIK